MLPWTPIVLPGCALSFMTVSARSPSTRVQLFQPTVVSVRLTTSLGTELMNGANGSMSEVGQMSAHSSYMTRPSSTWS